MPSILNCRRDLASANDLSQMLNDRSSFVRQRNFDSIAGVQIFDLADARIQFAVTGDDGDAKTATIRILQLLTDFLRVRVDFDTHAGRANLASELQVVA